MGRDEGGGRVKQSMKAKKVLEKALVVTSNERKSWTGEPTKRCHEHKCCADPKGLCPAEPSPTTKAD